MILTPCRDATPDELPRTAAALLRAATAAGWTSRATYAKAELGGKKARALAAGDRVTRDGKAGTIIDAHKPDGSPAVAYGVLLDGDGPGCGHAWGLHVWPVTETAAADESGRKGAVVESIAVRLRRYPLAAAGMWQDGKFSHAYVWSLWTTPNKVGARQLSKFVKDA